MPLIRRRAGISVGLVAVALLASACSRLFDAIVFNPCEEPAIVAFANRALTADETGWRAQITVGPVSARRVHEAFADPGDLGTGFIRVQIGGEPASIFELPLRGEEPYPVVIPTSAC